MTTQIPGHGEAHAAVAAQDPKPAPELAAAMAESRGYREALGRVLQEASRDRCTCSIVTGIAKRALDGKS